MVAAAALLALALVGQGSEIVIVLDNSGSMAAPYFDDRGHQYPANDPERAAVLGALVVEGLARGSADKVTVIQFGQGADPTPVVASGADAIRAVPYVGGTLFRKPLTEARRILEASTLQGHLFVIFTDGMPQDLRDPLEGPRILGLDVHPTWDRIAMGLYADPLAKEQGEVMLSPLVSSTDGLLFLKDAKGVVPAFTRAYARSLGSRAEVGTLSGGQAKSFEIGRYVTEVMVSLASTSPGDPFHATLVGPSGPVAVQAQGDNGCPAHNALGNSPKICSPPRRHYEVFRAPSNPDQPSKWALTLDSGAGSVEFGIILRYDLQAELTASASVRVGETVPLKARLLFKGKTFDDAAFFQADAFQADVKIGEETLPLKPEGGGVFSAAWTPKEPTNGIPAMATLVFRNAWLEKRASAQITVEGFLDLALRAQPASVELGAWRGDRKPTQRCATVDLSGSLNADRVPLTCLPARTPAGVAVTCVPLAEGQPAAGALPRQPLQWQVCAEATACCGDLDAGSAAVRFAGAHPHYAAGSIEVAVRYQVQSTGFLRCWWIWLASLVAFAFFVWLVAGLVRPFNFDPSTSIRVASSELGLRRAPGLILQEQPGGRRGFYRNAKLCLDGEGNFHRTPASASLVLEAGRAGLTRFTLAAALERKEARTGKWTPLTPEQMVQGHEPQVIYRIGNLFLQFS